MSGWLGFFILDGWVDGRALILLPVYYFAYLFVLGMGYTCIVRARLRYLYKRDPSSLCLLGESKYKKLRDLHR
jgi:hypothetical protein